MLKFKTSCAVLANLSSNLLNEVGLSLFRYFEVGLRACDIVVNKYVCYLISWWVLVEQYQRVTDRRTSRQTDRHMTTAYCASIASRGKNGSIFLSHMYLTPPLGWLHYNFNKIFGIRKLAVFMMINLAVLKEHRLVTNGWIKRRGHRIYCASIASCGENSSLGIIIKSGSA